MMTQNQDNQQKEQGISSNLQNSQFDKFNVLEQIGEGSEAEVWKIQHKESSLYLALKVYKSDRNQNKQAFKNTQISATREIELLNHLSHPHIIECYSPEISYIQLAQEQQNSEKCAYFLELCEELSLFDLVKKNKEIFKKGMSEPIVRYYFKQIVDTLEFLHINRYAHLDLKAENILFKFGDFKSIKLADFSFFTFCSGEKEWINPRGTPVYAAPEIMLKQRLTLNGEQYIEVNPFQADIYSLGVLLFVMSTGCYPFQFEEGQTQEQYKKLYSNLESDEYWEKIKEECELSSQLISLIRKLMKRNSCKRISFDQIKRHQWVQSKQSLSEESVDQWIHELGI